MPAQSIDLSARVEPIIAAHFTEARTAFEEILEWVASVHDTLTLHAFEVELGRKLANLALCLVSTWLVAALPRSVPVVQRRGGQCFEFEGLTKEVIRSTFGEVRTLRPTWRRGRRNEQVFISDHDRRLGLAAGRMSLGVHLAVGWITSLVPFDTGLEILQRVGGGYVPSKRAALGIVDGLGPQAAAFLDDLPAPDDDGEILIIQTDGKGAPMMRVDEHQQRCKPHRKQPGGLSKRALRRWRRGQRNRVRRKSGDKSKNARMATLGVVYTLRRLPDGTLEGPIHRRVIGTFTSAEKLFERLHREAVGRGYGTKECYFLADGDPHLWRMKQRFFPDATGCLDWYHLSEYLWEIGRTVYKEGSPELTRWVHARQTEMKNGAIDTVLVEIDAIRAKLSHKPGCQTRRERLDKARKYIEKRREILVYPALLAKDIDIATGIIEGAARHVVGLRLDGPGQRWSLERAEHVLALRCVVVNGDWDAFAKAVTRKHDAQRDWAVPRVTPIGPMTPYASVLARRKAA